MGYELLVMGYVGVAELVEATITDDVRFDRLNERRHVERSGAE